MYDKVVSGDNSKSLSYSGLGKLLQSLFMCSLNVEAENYAEERSLVKLIWEELS